MEQRKRVKSPDAAAFVGRAAAFEKLAQAAVMFRMDEPDYLDGQALLCVHAGIALNDAVLCHLTGGPHKGQDHRQAVREARRACGTAGIDPSGLRQLDRLLSQKNAVSYDLPRVREATADELLTAMSRLFNWFFNAFPEYRSSQP